MRIQGHLRTDETGKSSCRKIYICWIPESAEAKSNWVEEFYSGLKTINRDDARVPVSTERPANLSGSVLATEQQACRDGVTDFVFIATTPQIEQHKKLIRSDHNSDLKWVLDLQSAGDCTTPRIWLVPLERMALGWFKFPPRVLPEKFLNDYVWHLPMPSLVSSGTWPGNNFKVRGIKLNTDDSDLYEVRDGLLAHAADPCEICTN